MIRVQPERYNEGVRQKSEIYLSVTPWPLNSTSLLVATPLRCHPPSEGHLGEWGLRVVKDVRVKAYRTRRPPLKLMATPTPHQSSMYSLQRHPRGGSHEEK